MTEGLAGRQAGGGGRRKFANKLVRGLKGMRTSGRASGWAGAWAGKWAGKWMGWWAVGLAGKRAVQVVG